jgi:hypothetical protein
MINFVQCCFQNNQKQLELFKISHFEGSFKVNENQRQLTLEDERTRVDVLVKFSLTAVHTKNFPC